ncbi:Uncharacterised protein [Yersinia nurmii]|uniref:Uncharacterized protein n=1 Tax=Yersinia nurmii TaxID=685706 RepID=A0ABM9S2T8_9GAMM|nr:Uncharacterised protein [Yersinia nurmii]
MSTLVSRWQSYSVKPYMPFKPDLQPVVTMKLDGIYQEN